MGLSYLEALKIYQGHFWKALCLRLDFFNAFKQALAKNQGLKNVQKLISFYLAVMPKRLPKAAKNFLSTR